MHGEHLGDVRAPARGAVNSLERPRGRERQLRVLRVELEDAAVNHLCACRILDRVFVEGRDGAEDVGARLGSVRRIGRLEQNGCRALLRARPMRDFEQTLSRLVVARRERNEAREGVERAGIVAQTLVAKVRDPPEKLTTLPDVGYALETDLEHAHELAHVVARDVDALEDHRRARAERRDVQAFFDDVARFAPGRICLQNVVEILEGLRRVPETREAKRAEAQTEDERVCRRRLSNSALEELREVRPAFLRRVQDVE